MTGPLDGVRVLDLSVVVSGPLATMMLADQGADVIKVETPGLGDIVRYLGSSRAGMSGLFVNCNRGKRSITLDLKHPLGLDLFRRMVEQADVLVQNYRPGTAERLGIGYDDLHLLNDDLIYVSISGFGQDGPYAGRRVYDNVIQAYSGFAGVQTDPRNGEPTVLRTLVCDKITAYAAAQAITAALFNRARGGRGQHIELAMLDSAVSFLWPDAGMDLTLLEDDATRAPTIASFYSTTRMSDGFTTTTVLSDAEWHGLCAAVGRLDLVSDPRFLTLPDRMANAHEMVALMGAAARTTSRADFIAAAEAHDVPAAPVLELAEVPDDPQIQHNRVFAYRHHPTVGAVREVRSAASFSGTPAITASPAPRLGEHSDEIAAEFGFSGHELRTAGAIG